MSTVEDKKQERTKAKQQVTKASKRLTGAVERNADVDVLTAMMVELEKVYDDFCVIDEEYQTLVLDEEHAEHRIVNGLDITAYRTNVNEVYTGARKDFEQAKASKTSGVVQQGTVTIPSATLAHPSGPSVSLAVQGTSQSGNNDNPDQPATSVVTATSQTQSVTLPASTVQASNNFPFGMGSIHPLGYSMAPTPQYPLLQSTTQQSTMTHVHTGSLSSGLPHQSVSYVMPSQSNASQANDLMGFDPITV